MMKDYDFRKQQILNELYKPVEHVAKAVQNVPDSFHKTIGKLHSDLRAQSHPASAHTNSIIAADPENAKLILPSYMQKIVKQASSMAHADVAGPNNEKLIGLLMPLYEKNDNFSEAHANALLDIASNQFQDATRPLEISSAGTLTSGVDQSKVKIGMRNAIALENNFRKAQRLLGVGSAPEIQTNLKRFDTTSVHQRSNAIESFALQRARWYLAPMIAISHLSTFFNPLATAPLGAIYKGLASMENVEVKELTEAASVFLSQHFHMLGEDMTSSMNILASATGMPEVGRLYSQIFHNPGFNFIRNAQLKATAAMGFHATEWWAEQAARGSKIAQTELKDLGLDADGIVERGGKLTREEKIKAIYYYTNNNMFISKRLDRSLNATRNPWTRMLTMFHGYFTSQQRFIRKELQKKIEARDYVGIARLAGTIGLVFPAIAPMLKAMEVTARTGSPATAVQGMGSDYKHLTSPESAYQFSAEYLDMLSHFGSLGMMHSFITAAHGDRLALYAMGPIASDVMRTGQDAINLATKDTQTGKHNIKPLAKDILQQTVPVAGNIIAHQLFPVEPKND
jgi:hypothetical protein